jgi:hypothetical protein
VSKKLVKAQKANTPEVILPSANNVDPATPATQPRSGHTRRSSIDMLLQDQGTNQFINQTRRDLYGRPSKKANMAGAEKKAFDDAEEYVYEYQKKQRAKKSKNRRELNDAELIEAKKRIAEKILQQNDAVADARPAEKAKQARRRLRMDDDESETKIAPEEQNLARMKELVKHNKSIRQKYEHIIRGFTQQNNYSQVQLHNALKGSIASDIDARTNDGFFAANSSLKPSSRAQSQSSFNSYLAKVRAQLNAVLY